MTARAAAGLAMLGGLACADRAAVHRPAAERPAADHSSRSGTPAVSAPADSLVATTAGGTEIWFTLARFDSGGGRRCTARAIEIRRGAARLPVPLLYTVAAPVVVNETTLRARLSDRCIPGDRYLVDLRTGHPVRER